MLTDFWFLAYIFLSSKSAFRFSWGSTFPAFFDGAKIWRHFETAISSMWTNTRTTTIDYQYFSKFPYGQRTKTHPCSPVRTAQFFNRIFAGRQSVHQIHFSCTNCRISPASYTRSHYPVRNVVIVLPAGSAVVSQCDTSGKRNPVCTPEAILLYGLPAGGIVTLEW